MTADLASLPKPPAVSPAAPPANLPDHLPDMAAVILAGGQSRRFGRNKALARLQDRPLIGHVAAVLEELFSERMLVTNQPEDYSFLGWPTIPDLLPGAGPLAGIQAALNKIAAPRALVVACDMPRLDAGVIRRLCLYPGDWDVVLPAPEGAPEPLHAVYHRRILPTLDAALARGERKVGRLLAELRVRALDAAELGLQPGEASRQVFANINFRRDLDELQAGRP